MSIEDANDLELKESAAAGQLAQAVGKLTGVCFDLCVDKPRDRFDYKTENCITNCTDRFIDVTAIITQRFQQLIQKQLGNY